MVRSALRRQLSEDPHPLAGAQDVGANALTRLSLEQDDRLVARDFARSPGKGAAGAFSLSVAAHAGLFAAAVLLASWSAVTDTPREQGIEVTLEPSGQGPGKESAAPGRAAKEQAEKLQAEKAQADAVQSEQAAAREAERRAAEAEAAQNESAKQKAAAQARASEDASKAAEAKAEDAKAADVKAEEARGRQEAQAQAEQAQTEQAKAEQAKAEQARAEAATKMAAQKAAAATAATQKSAQAKTPSTPKPQAEKPAAEKTARPAREAKAEASARRHASLNGGAKEAAAQTPAQTSRFMAHGAQLPFDNGPPIFRAVAVPLPTEGGDEPMSYKMIVFGMLERAKRYPPSARERGARGSVAVAFTVDDDGELVNVSLLHSSGDADLDVESLALVARASPFPKPPPDGQRSFAAEISFDLRETE